MVDHRVGLLPHPHAFRSQQGGAARAGAAPHHAGFMTWKMATSFVLTAETWLGAEETREGDEALLAIGVSPERLS
jgi:hypothetical protein